MSQFVHLHLHSQYSLLDGANKLPHVLERAHKLGQPAISLTDHGNLHGAIEFYTAAKKIGIKPLIGCELYVTPGSRFERKMKNQGGAGTNHLTVLAESLEGYHNLCRLVTLSHREGFYFKPRVDHELLERYNEGLIVLSGCLAGELAAEVERDGHQEAKKVVEYYASLFKDRYYLEVQPHPIKEQQKLNGVCVDLARELGIPLVATTDCHYLEEGDHYAQEVLMCVSTGKKVTDPDRLRHEGVKLHLKTADEMRAEFGDVAYRDEAIASSVAIAERCNVSFDFSKHFMPQFTSPDERPLIEVMGDLAREGLVRRLDLLRATNPSWSEADDTVYRDRLEREIQLIDRMGFAGYFLVVSDFIVWAKEQGIPVGPGRGSAAGSLVAYSLRITEVDPIQNKLLFERFLNPDRISLPDIDVDFCINGRDRVIQYVVEKYGKEKVAQIATFGTLKAKAAIKDVGRALGMSYAEMDRVAQLVPAPRQGFDFSIEEAMKMEPKLRAYADAEGREHIALAQKLEGLTRHTSTHAAGVVIGDRPLIDMLPMMVDKDGNEVTQYSMNYVEKIGLVKFDFLGLKTLTVIHTALRLIEGSQNKKIDLERLPLDDALTFSLLCQGNTTGVFQLESSGITEMTMRLKPNCFDDLVATIALYRPGPLDAGMVEVYIERKHGREKISYLHPLMEGTLRDTYGIILYQEQIMQLARELAGYSLAEADILRKAMGKKNPEEMAKQGARFIGGAVERGIQKKLAEEIFQQMETFARYGFNRSHSAAYALVSYQTAYLKAHYSVEFMAALMSNDIEDTDKILKNLNECKKQRIAILPPNINSSLASFSVQEGKIRYGLEAVKGIGGKAVEEIIRAREEGGPFADLEDMLERIDISQINRRVLENLIKSGAIDLNGTSRRELLDRLEEVHRAAQALVEQRATNQISLFGGVNQKPTIPRRTSSAPEWPVNKRLSFEREALGFYLSGHPLEKFAEELKRLGTLATVDVRSRGKQSDARLAGVITGLKLKNTKKGDRYATFTLEDSLGTIETVVWPDLYKTIPEILEGEDPVLVTGRADVTEERCTLIAEKVESLISLRDRSAKLGILTVGSDDLAQDRVEALHGLFKKYSGPCPVRVKMGVGQREVSLSLRHREEQPVTVLPSEVLCEEVEQIFGRPVLSFL